MSVEQHLLLRLRGRTSRKKGKGALIHEHMPEKLRPHSPPRSRSAHLG